MKCFPVGFEVFVSLEFYLNDLIALLGAFNTLAFGSGPCIFIQFISCILLLVNFHFEIALLICKIG